MKKLVFAVVLVLLFALVIGCTSQTRTGASTCPSPYDGTYSGTVSGSGESHHMPDVNGNSQPDTPYILTYNLEVTFECYNQVTGDDNQRYWILDVTHAKVSDPFFDCTNGCTPINNHQMNTIGGTSVTILQPGERTENSTLSIAFPDGKSLYVTPLFADPDAKIISADQSYHDWLVSASILGTCDSVDQPCFIENGLCRDCYSGIIGFNQEGFTMTLNRVS